MSHRWPLYAAILQVPWFILLSITRARMGGTSALLVVKVIDLLVPLPAFGGVVLGAALLWRASGHGGVALWGGTLACAALGAGFLWLLWNR